MRTKTIFSISFLILSIFHFSCGNSKNEINKSTNVSTVVQNKEFKTVKIGNQVWMSENLNIPTDTGSFAYNYDDSKGKIFGRLYNWETAKKICPKGWRLPTIEDYYELFKFYGTYDVVGGKLKSTKYWTEPSVGNADSNSFNALPAGFCNGDSFFGENVSTKFWTATEQPTDHAAYIELEINTFEVKDDFHHKRYALSVRYIKE